MRRIFTLLIVLAMAADAWAWKPLFVGHHGCNIGVENTADTYRNCVDVYGYNSLECDVRVTKGGWGAYLPVPVAVGYWVAKNRCTHEVTERVESLKGNEGHPIIKHRYTSPSTDCDVWLYEVVGGVHSWFTDDIDTGEEIWQFFSRYLK